MTEMEEDRIFVVKDGELVTVEAQSFPLPELIHGSDGTISEEPVAELTQFPLRPAYAVTIHKSQGMGIRRLVCNIDHIFADSQFYVAISRGIDPATLYLQYSRRDLDGYLHRAVRVSERVAAYYENAEPLRPEEP